MAQTPKYQEEYELAKAQLPQRLSDIHLKFNEVMAAVAHTIRTDLKQPYDDRLDLPNTARLKVEDIGHDVLILMRDTHKASKAYHKAKARYARTRDKGEGSTQ